MNNKVNIKLIIAIIIVFLLVLGIYFLHQKLTNNFSDEEIKQITLSVEDLPNYNDSVLYNYSKSNESNLQKYLNSLSNNYKLLIGGIDESISFSKIKQNLINKYGSDLNVEAKDYYMFESDKEPAYVLKDGIYVYNENSTETEYLTDVGEYNLYNYEVKKVAREDNLVTVTYYGLLYQSPMGEPDVYYNKNMNLLNKEKGESYQEFDVDNYFENNKDKFFAFKYYLKLYNDSYVINDFKILN